MPRPGPRPYECVRRAWHSDRHQPIRGSLIQEIFRVVNEIHSSATKKNKEWQEKIPIVVLKAEEIMYSKANSEAEYMDPKTLWGRANDAINTIIRRDESTETGKFLPPCIEAALILGCTPRRASRSQRNNNQRCYLNPHNQEPTSITSSILDNTTHGIHMTNYTSHYPNLVKFPTMKLAHFGSEPLCLVSESNSFPNNKFPSSYYFPPSSNIQCLLKETCPASKSYSVYPLYYGNNLQFNESQFGFGIPPKPNCSVVKPNDMGIIQNRFPYDLDASKKTMQTEPGDIPENQPFDLSLRLAPLSVPCSTVNNSLSLEVEDVISSSARKGSKSSIPLPQKGKGFSFFHMGNTDVSLDSSLSKWSPQQATMGKRKANVSHPTEDMIFCSQPKRQSFHFTHFNGGRRNAD